MIVINPGAGPINVGSEDAARRSLAALLGEVGLEPQPTVKMLGIDDTGRYSFRVRWEDSETVVDMPGLDREELQMRPGYWPPRLYVDGSSWWWPYAVNMVRDALAPEIRDETAAPTAGPTLTPYEDVDSAGRKR